MQDKFVTYRWLTNPMKIAKFTYLGVAVRNLNFVHEEIKVKLDSRNACYGSIQNVSCSSCSLKT
jgi:hypothetical protein